MFPFPSDSAASTTTTAASDVKPADSADQLVEQPVYLKCVDAQGKVYLIPQKVLAKVGSV